MKTKFFLVAGLLVSAVVSSQNYTAPSSAGGSSIGSNNVYLGHDAAAGSTVTGSENVYIGWSAGKTNSGYQNVMIGNESGRVNLNGSFSSFYGYAAGREANGNYNVGIGWNAGKTTVGSNNISLGSRAGFYSNADNTSIGHEAGYYSVGSKNVFVGSGAGRGSGTSLKPGTGNILIGYQAGSYETGNNKLYIANSNTLNPLIYGEFKDPTIFGSVNILKINAKRVGIGIDDTTGSFGAFPNVDGTGTPDVSAYSLFVRGGILTEEVRIRTHNNWPDYVFEDDYNLLTLNEVESFIKSNGHLPNVPSAAQVKKEGFEVGDIVKVQQEKIEELTLYLIEQNKQIKELKTQIQILLNNR